MAKVKVVNNVLDSNLNGVNFNNTASQTIFSFGRFVVTSNFEGRVPIDYTGTLSSFVRPVTLETLGLSQTQSEILLRTTTNAVLNLDKSDLNTFVRYGSAYEFLRVTVENIILSYPASLFVNSQANVGGNITFSGFNYNSTTNISTFKIPTGYTSNIFGLILNAGNTSAPDGNELRNLNLSYDKYIIWSQLNPTGNSYFIIGFTGYSSGDKFITLEVQGNPFPMLFSGDTSGQSGSLDFHLKPNNVVFEEFRTQLSDYEKYILSKRIETSGFEFMMKNPTLLDDGTINYADTTLLWNTSDGYNIDISGAKYRNFLEVILRIGGKYDAIKTDLIARFLTPASIKTYDLTEEGKMTKLLRLYGREFDELRQFIDSLVNINRITYNKINNAPDQLIKNLAKTFGWDYFSLVNENEFVETILTIDDTERDLYDDLLPAEIDIELWRRILNNTNYYWKSKGTREAIKSMFLLIGIPEPFINITEYVYTVNGKINPNSVTLTEADFPSNSLPYNTDGYPIAPIETNNFYFQVSGDTDSGQAYMDVFRMAGFNLIQTVDNKKSWVEEGAITRIDDTTPQYYQQDSKLVLNTKEVDVALDTARGIEYDAFDYIKNTDFPANSSGYTLPFSYVNISLNYNGTKNAFKLPLPYSGSTLQGDLEVRYNGILLNGQKEYSGGTGGTYFMDAGLSFSGITGSSTHMVFTGATGGTDYIVSGDSFIITNNNYAINSGNGRDVIQATFMYKNPATLMTGSTLSGISVNYMVTRVAKLPNGSTTIPLPSTPHGDVQVTINGVALTKGTGQFTADYIVDANNNQLIIQNPDLVPYLSISPYLQVAYLEVTGSSSINMRSEVIRVDSFSSGKIYYNISASKYVYKLNYKVNTASDLKVLVDGIALEPNKDYSLNSQNPYEIFLPNGIKYGTVISVYYLVGGNEIFFPVVADNFGVGDISQLSFLEFLELIQRRMINVRTRKTITDFKGGWYPTLLNVYLEYLKRAELDPENSLLSNGYTFSNLYTFLSKYNAFFQRFVDQLLSATIILKKGGLVVRNTVFTKQKFTYKRGVNLYALNSSTSDMRGHAMYQYLGDAGSVFKIIQEDAPAELYVETIGGIACYDELGGGIGRIENTGGMNVLNYDLITNYGMEYKCGASGTWLCQPNPLCTEMLTTDMYSAIISGLTEGSTYQYRAVVKSDTITAYGQTCSIIIPAKPIDPIIITPSACTYAGGFTNNTILNTGGYVLPVGIGSGVTAYGMQYSAGTTIVVPTFVPTVTTSVLVNCTTTSLNLLKHKMEDNGMLPIQEYGVIYTQNVAQSTLLNYGNSSICCCTCCQDIPNETFYPTNITGLTPNTNTYYRAYAKNSTGVGYGNSITTKTCAVSTLPVNFNHILGGQSGIDGVDVDVCECGCLYSSLSVGQSYSATLSWRLCKQPTTLVVPTCYEIIRWRGGSRTVLNTCTISSKSLYCDCNGSYIINVDYGDCIHVVTHACTTAGSGQSLACVAITSVSSGRSIGSSALQQSYTCSDSGTSGGEKLPELAK